MVGRGGRGGVGRCKKMSESVLRRCCDETKSKCKMSSIPNAERRCVLRGWVERSIS